MHKTLVGPAMMDGVETWEKKIFDVNEMRMLSWRHGKRRSETSTYEGGAVGVAYI